MGRGRDERVGRNGRGLEREVGAKQTEHMIFHLIISRYTNTLLKRVASGSVCYSKSRKCFVSRKSLAFKAEEYTDLTGNSLCYRHTYV